MKFVLVICVSAALLSAAFGQVANDPERIIRRTVDEGISDGRDQKILGDLGDGAAVLLTKIPAEI